jgi:hypothetical protein
VHKALSFDVLHTIWLGVWGKHLWPLLLEHCLTKPGLKTLNERLS